MATLQKIALVFTIVGALNWGLIGIFNFNLVETHYLCDSWNMRGYKYRNVIHEF